MPTAGQAQTDEPVVRVDALDINHGLPPVPTLLGADPHKPDPGRNTMRFYTQQHTHYCGVDLHTKTMFLCVLDQ